MTGRRGLGPAAIRTFGTTHIFVNLDIAAIIADPAADNSRSLSAFRKAGLRIVRTARLTGEAADRNVVRFERGW